MRKTIYLLLGGVFILFCALTICFAEDNLSIPMPEAYYPDYCYIYPVPEDWKGTTKEWIEYNVAEIHIKEKTRTGQQRKDAKDAADIREPIVGIGITK
ncbi:MAG TPA: hypothetical protein ENI13_01395 [candidate division CPR3 bacterium]|uniref:Uncharacterized protein n=1 Tax=candidate division CPR3 bacterium TaxID=2268181 RepID=A0A7C1SPW7_UNCC3|nr:hypothetical protein [candidate division CPR3 bacterium]